MEREIALHSRLRHRNIVAFHAHFADRDHVYMVLEYCSRQVAGVGRDLVGGVGLAATGRGLVEEGEAYQWAGLGMLALGRLSPAVWSSVNHSLLLEGVSCVGQGAGHWEPGRRPLPCPICASASL